MRILRLMSRKKNFEKPFSFDEQRKLLILACSTMLGLMATTLLIG